MAKPLIILDDESGMGDTFWISYYETCLKLNNKKDRKKDISSACKSINKFLDHLKLPQVTPNEVQALLHSPFTEGDLTRTFHLIRYFQLSKQGLFITNELMDKSGNMIQYIGADNWENVMCYLDSLLFAMFANLDSFEPILFISNQFENPLINRLSNLLRVYVNLLRSGNLIKIDLTIKICETLSKLGFSEAMSHKQQDSATLFEFLTEILSMPLLTFKIDIQHSGKFSEEDDRKYSKERMLFVSIPDDEELGALEGRRTEKLDNVDDKSNDDGKDRETSEKEIKNGNDVILLEECLEHYFNSSISVMRELERRATMESFNKNSIGNKDVDIDEQSELTNDQISLSNSSTFKSNTRVQVRTRSSTLSIWTIDESNKEPSKEVSLPAWMFLRLLPFYTDDNNVSISKNGNINSTAKNSKEFANRRPVLPICLKRYSYENQKANRLQKKIIIPPIINLPKFVADGDNDNKNLGNYKLILESAICHRGSSISSGHFVAAVRKNYYKINETDDEASSAPWLLYDDLHKPKVVEKSFSEIFNTEWPYMLFYRLISIEESNVSSQISVHSCLSSPKVIVPQGSKSKYWHDEANNNTVLSPILSASNSPTLKPVSNETSSLGKTVTNSSLNSTISIPIPDVSPLDSKFTDIRQRYYWYIPDDEKNYYKEYSSSNHGTRRPSLTAQFRRNSQWSDNSEKFLKDINQKLHNLPNNSDTKIARVSSPSHNSQILEDTISNISLSNTTETKPDIKPEKPEKQHHHHFRILTDDRKKARKKRDRYKRDKCIII